MGRKNRNKNKNKKKSVPLSLSEFSKKYGVELFEEDNILNSLPTGPSGVMIPSSSQQNDEYLKKDNWRGSNVPSGGDPLVENKADTEINWRSKSNSEKNNSYVLPNASKFSFRNKESTNSFVPRISKFTTNNTNNSSNNRYVPSNKSKFLLKRNGDSSIPTNTSKFTFKNKETFSSNRFNLIKSDEKVSSRFEQFNKWQEDLSKKQDSLVEKSIKKKKIQDEYNHNHKYTYMFEKKPEPKNIPNVPDDNNVTLMKKKKKKKKKKEDGFFLMELTQEDKDMIKASVRIYEDEEEEENKKENEKYDEIENEDYSDDDISQKYDGFEPKYI